MLTVRRDFVNRTSEIQKLQSILIAEGIDKDSFILLHGRQGLGKTQLLARYLRLCNSDNICIAYVDLPNKDYLGLIDEIEEGLGKKGFEPLDIVYDDILSQFKIEDRPVDAKGIQAQMQPAPSGEASGQAPGIVFNQPVSGENQFFVSGNLVFNNPKITQIFNLQLNESEWVQGFNQKKITNAFHDCLHGIAQERPYVILLDHWEGATDPLKNWLKAHLFEWAAELYLRKALVVLAREDMPEEYKNQMGILELAVQPFDRQAALEFWLKNGLKVEIFNTLGIDIYSIPGILAIEIDKQHLIQANK